MKLFRVSAEVELVVVAKDDAAERMVEDRLVRVEDGGSEVNAIADRLFNPGYLPSGWSLDALPFGTEGDKTIGDYLKEDAECMSADSQEKA